MTPRIAPATHPWGGLCAARALPDAAPAEATAPCLDCCSACCWIAQLFSATPRHLMDVDFFRYALNFDNIEIGINWKGEWVINLRAACRHLDPGTFACRIHAAESKPKVCADYDAQKCMYRTNFLGQDKASYLRLDQQRMTAYMNLTRFGETGDILSLPSPEEALAAFQSAGDGSAARAAADLPESPSRISPKKAFAAPVPESADAGRPGADALLSPCLRCEAPCCRVLVFDFGLPRSASAVDYMRYLLGFPGLELALTESAGWKIVVNSTCRFHDAETSFCRLSGLPERPLTCVYYNEYKCAYRGWLLQPQRMPFVRIDHDGFLALRKHFMTAPDGSVAVQLTPPQMEAVMALARRRSEGSRR